MIKQYRLHVKDKSDNRFSYSSAYYFYGMLMEFIDDEYGELLHEQTNMSINQYLVPERDKNEALWTVNLLDGNAIEVFSKILDKNKSYYIKNTNSDINVLSLEQKAITDEKALIDYAVKAYETNIYNIKFVTTTSFKSANEYMIFPSVNHIVNSLVNKWNSYSRTYVIDDEDAVNMIVSNLKIVEYRLRSSVFMLKGNRIPGFIGEARIYSRLSVALNEIWNILSYFSSYSGMGIKAALGMGGVSITGGGKA
jgi:CRISPR-associated endoribonuclease Cas6